MSATGKIFIINMSKNIMNFGRKHLEFASDDLIDMEVCSPMLHNAYLS